MHVLISPSHIMFPMIWIYPILNVNIGAVCYNYSVVH